MELPDEYYRAVERQAAAIVRLASHRDIEQAVLDAHATGLGPTAIAKHAGRTRQWVHGILRKHAKPAAIHHINGNPYDNRPKNLEIVDPATHTRTAKPDTEETQP